MKFFVKIRSAFWLLVYKRTGSLKALGRYRTVAHIVKQPDKRLSRKNLDSAKLGSPIAHSVRTDYVLKTVVNKPVHIDLVGDQIYKVNETLNSASHEGRVDSANGHWSSPIVSEIK